MFFTFSLSGFFICNFHNGWNILSTLCKKTFMEFNGNYRLKITNRIILYQSLAYKYQITKFAVQKLNRNSYNLALFHAAMLHWSYLSSMF
jgi:hypothetical protein